MAILSMRPTPSNTDVGHDPDGTVRVGSAASIKKDGFKTYRPSPAEAHLKRPAMYDSYPNSAFSPFTSSFNLSNKARKDQARAGQRAELDHILQPGYRPSKADQKDGDSSHAGPSRLSAPRTAGGLAGAGRRGKAAGSGIRPSASLGSFKYAPNSATSGNFGGLYVDSNGKVHDVEYDPFAGVSEMSRRKTKRRSAFGSDRRKGSGSETSSEEGTEVNGTGTVDDGRDEEAIRRRLDIERRKHDELSGHTAARRKSMVSDRSSGRATPSIRSSEDGHNSSHSTFYERSGGRSRSQQGYYVPSPLSPTFGLPSSTSHAASRALPTTVEHVNIEESPPQKSTERTQSPPQLKTPLSVSMSDRKITITGFDAPHAARPLSPQPKTPATAHMDSLRVPDSARLSAASRRSSESGRPPKPAERSREELFPETPAQAKRREDREKRHGRSSAAGLARGRTLAVDTALISGARVLPEIEIVEDDDPRIIFPEHGRTTRVQTKHDHVIRGPFSLALHAQSSGQSGRRSSAEHSAKSLFAGSGSKAPSTMVDEGYGGYLPTRWASGDKFLRQTEDEKDKYRPREWGGKTGDLAGKSGEWKPSMKDEMKRNWKDIATNARFSMFRAKKKLLRKADV